MNTLSKESGPGPRQAPQALRGRRALAIVVLVFAAVVLALLVWLRGPQAEERAIRRLPEGERRALYERTLRTLESSCEPSKRPKGLEDFCREQAEFVARFPDCDASCRAVAAKFRHLPSR